MNMEKIQWTDAEKRRMKQILNAVDEMSRMHWDLIKRNPHDKRWFKYLRAWWERRATLKPMPPAMMKDDK
jgi:hypothetical protein